MQLQTQNSAINSDITVVRTNQTSAIIGDFKTDIIKGETALYILHLSHNVHYNYTSNKYELYHSLIALLKEN